MKAKIKFTKLWSILLALAMVVGMLPIAALAAGSATATADFTVGDGTAALALLNDAKTGTTASTWDGSTLTLNGVNFETTAATAVKLPDDAKIVLNGENTIKGSNSDSRDCYGIYGEGDLTIQGSGTLNVNGGDAKESSYGIYAYPGGVTIDGGIVTAKGGKTTNYASYGIAAATDVTINGGTVTATGGTAGTESYGIIASPGGVTIDGGANVTATGGTAGGDSCGIKAKDNVTISGTAVVTATGGTTEGTYGVSYGIFVSIGSVNISGGKVEATGGTADGNSGNSYGIRANDSVSISGGEVEANGGKADSYSNGIYADKDVSITGGTVTATGGATKIGKSNGIYADDGNVTISGGTVTANGGTSQNGNSYGICAYSGSVSIQDTADVTAQAGAAGGESYGIFAYYGNVTISGGEVEANGGKADSYSNGIYADKDVSISGGKVKATGGTASSGSSRGIFANKDVTIQDTADVTAKGGTASGTYRYSCGIWAYQKVSVNGKVKATGGAAEGSSGKSYGIWASQDVTISGGSLIAQGTTGSTVGAMNKVPSVSLSAYQWRTSADDSFSKYPDSACSWTSTSTYLEVTTATGFTVTFDANGGTGTMTDVTGVLGEYTLPANGFTAPEGKQFKAWSVNGTEKAVGDKITVTADTTVKAVWENIPVTTYTVSFDANGGKGTMADVTGILGDYTLPANGFTAPDGKQFKSWSVDGKEKAVGDKITVTADTTVKAVWETLPAASADYDILNGANSKWTQDSDGNISVRGSGEFSKFVGVKVDGKTVDEKYYTVKEGSTIVTLKPEYLNTLTAGKHTIEIVWTDGTADTTFTVDAKPSNTDTKSPQTGDSSSIALWIALLFVSAAGVLLTAVLGKKKKRSAR